MFEPRYIKQLSNGSYVLVLTDSIEGLGKGGTDIPGMQLSREFSNLRDASEFLTKMYQDTIDILIKQAKNLTRQRRETTNLLQLYFAKYGDQRSHPEFNNYKEVK